MTEMGICLGCCINPGWPGYLPPPPPMVNFTLPDHTIKIDFLLGVRLTPSEEDILKKLAEAWSIFMSLDKTSDADKNEYMDAIHRAQQIIALRVARRVNPEVWHQPS
jgi:hypothetical protein